MINETIKEFGKVDILVNNAGVGDKMQAAENVEDEVWERAMSINVDGIMRATRQVIPVFLQNGSGNIINMASISGLTGGGRGGFTYTATKHAVIGMTKNIASHYGPQEIRCNAIAPAQVQTNLTQNMDGIDEVGMKLSVRGVNLMPKAATTEDIANIALFLASNESSYINGTVIAADVDWSAY